MGQHIIKGRVFNYTAQDDKRVKVTISTGGAQPALWGVFLDGETLQKGKSTPKTITVGKGSELHGKTLEVKVVTFDQEDDSDLISAKIEIEGVDDPKPYEEEFDAEPDSWLSVNGLYFLT